MTYERFEMAPAWKAAIELAENVFILTRSVSEHFQTMPTLRDTLERTSVSVANDIAGGFEQGTTQAMNHALMGAKGAVGEVRSMLWLMEKMPDFVAERPKLAHCRELTDQCTRLLVEWSEKVQHIAQFGQKHYLDAAKEEERRKNERERMARERRELFDDLRRLSQS